MQDERNTKAKSEVNVMVAAALSTLFWLVVAVALAAAVFRICFPLAAMRLYEDMGNIPRAYECAAQAARSGRDSADRVNARLKRTNFAISLMRTDEKEYARETADAIEQFLSDPSCLDRAELVDEYNLRSSAAKLHPNLYSYADYLHSENARARYILGEQKLYRCEGYVTAKEALGAVVSPEETAVLFGQIAAVAGQASASGDKTPDLAPNELTVRAKQYIAEVLAGIGDKPALRDVYLVKAYEKLYTRLSYGGYLSAAELNELNTLEYKGTTYTVSELYYDTLLESYASEYQRNTH